MAHSVEDDVVAGPRQDHAFAWKVDSESAAYQEDGSRALLVCDPIRPFVTPRMDGPLDLNGLAMARVLGRHEMTEHPVAMLRAVIYRVPGINLLGHGR